MFGLGVPELLIILAVVLLLFGGARIAGLGKSTGRALREFKEETKDLKAKEQDDARSVEGPRPNPVQQPPGPPMSAPTEPPINTAWQTPPATCRTSQRETPKTPSDSYPFPLTWRSLFVVGPIRFSLASEAAAIPPAAR